MPNEFIQHAQEILTQVLGPELEQIVSLIATEPGTPGSFHIDLPDPASVDLNSSDLASQVVRTSNVYGRIARFGGMARAELKLAEGRYKKKYKMALASPGAKNQQQREALALQAAEDEYTTFITLEAMVELAEAQETAARIASESARKLYDKVAAMNVAQSRQEHGWSSQVGYP